MNSFQSCKTILDARVKLTIIIVLFYIVFFAVCCMLGVLSDL